MPTAAARVVFVFGLAADGYGKQGAAVEAVEQEMISVLCSPK